MKKRSLFAAVAMLIVSAIVLTSATYAWFTASADTVAVDAISAKVTKSDGSIQIKANYNKSATAGEAWTDVLHASDFIYSANQPLNAVSVDFGSGSNGVYTTMGGPIKVDYDGSNFTGGNTPTDGNEGSTVDYIHYSFDVRMTSSSPDGKTVTMTPDFTRGGSFIYAAVKVGDNYYVYDGGNSDSYVPVKTVVGTIVDNDENGEKAIIDSNDSNYVAGNMGNTVNGAAVSAIELWNANNTKSADGSIKTFTQTVNVYIWAEGNDTNCRGTVDTSGTSLEFTFA